MRSGPANETNRMPKALRGTRSQCDVRYVAFPDDRRLDVAEQVPLVDYLVLGDEPHLQANECTACGARFFDRRNACASCGKTDFTKAAIAKALKG